MADDWTLSVYRRRQDARVAAPPAVGRTLRFGHDTVIVTREEEVPPAGADSRQRLASPTALHLVAQVGNRFEAEHPEVPILYRSGRYLLIEVEPSRADQLTSPACYAIEPVRESDVIFDVQPPPAAAPARAANISGLVAALSRTRLQQSLEHLVSFETRESTSDRFRDAAEWAADQLGANGYQARLEEIAVGPQRSCNVVAEPAAPSDGGGTVLITAHLDSVNQEQTHASAPGADDNGSGAAGVLELAACLAGRSCGRRLRFILFGGEEQGLFGSTAYVAALPAQPNIDAVVNMDMIATKNGTATPTVLIEGGQISVPMMDRLTAAAHTYTGLTVQRSLHYYNSDHVPFIDAAIPAVLLIEGNDSANTHVHSARDTLAHVDYDLMSEILRMHLAFLGELCGLGG